MKRQEIKQVLDELTKDIDSLADKKAVTIITSFPEKIVPRFYSRVQHLNKPRFSPFLLHIL